MCLLSVYINNNANARFRVLIASNRDEFYDRKAKVLSNWSSSNEISCFGGRDFEPGREGGTWLALSSLRKIGVLLNVREKEINSNAKPRGNLVVNYVNDYVDAVAYAANLETEASAYNGFQLLMIERENHSNDEKQSQSASPWKILRCSNRQTPHTSALFDSNSQQQDQTGVYMQTFTSASLDESYPKNSAANRRFASILDRLDSFSSTDDLFDEMEQKLLKSYFNDISNDSERQSHGQSNRTGNLGLDDRLDDVFVKIPEVRYGTRTHTLIAIDQDSKCSIRERTLIEPVQVNSIENESSWQTTQLTVQL